jgi:hypothetical protein
MRAEERVIEAAPMERRTVRAAAVAPLPGITAVAATIHWWGRLPDPMAIHWSLTGHPDGSLVRGAAVALVVGIAVVSGLSSCSLVLLGVRGAGLLAGVGALFSWVAWCAIVANEGAPTWYGAGRLPLVAVLPGVAAGAAVALVVERGVVAPSSWEAGAWRGRVGWSPVAPAVVAVLALLVLVFVQAWAAVVPLVVVALALTTLSPVRVTADRRGLAIYCGWLPWPVTTIALSEIRSAGTIELRPAELGGRGYRGLGQRARGWAGVALHRRAALLVRRGPAIRLDLRDGSTFAVSVDGAADAAEVLNGLLTP